MGERHARLRNPRRLLPTLILDDLRHHAHRLFRLSECRQRLAAFATWSNPTEHSSNSIRPCPQLGRILRISMELGPNIAELNPQQPKLGRTSAKFGRLPPDWAEPNPNLVEVMPDSSDVAPNLAECGQITEICRNSAKHARNCAEHVDVNLDMARW